MKTAEEERQTLPSTAEERVAVLVEIVGSELLGWLRCNTVPVEDSADVLALTFETAWKKRQSLPLDVSAARAWMYRVARNHLFHQRRGGMRQQAVAERLKARIEDQERNYSAGESDDELQLKLLLNQLDEESRLALSLTAGQGFTFPEVAEILGISESTVRRRVAAAKQYLRERMGE